MTFTLTRICPDGVTRQHENLTDKFTAAMAVRYVLMDNRATRSKSVANAIAAEVERAPLGVPVEALGYTFTVTEQEVA